MCRNPFKWHPGSGLPQFRVLLLRHLRRCCGCGGRVEWKARDDGQWRWVIVVLIYPMFFFGAGFQPSSKSIGDVDPNVWSSQRVREQLESGLDCTISQCDTQKIRSHGGTRQILRIQSNVEMVSWFHPCWDMICTCSKRACSRDRFESTTNVMKLADWCVSNPASHLQVAAG